MTPENQAIPTPPDLSTPQPRVLDRHFWRGLILLLILALPLRLAILEEFLRMNPIAEMPMSDGDVYWRMAARMAQGRWIDETPFLSAPLYPYLLGVIRTLGGGLPAVYLVQIGLHLLSAVGLALGARPRFGAPAALLAAAGFLLLTEPAVSTTRVMPNTLQVFLVTLLWWRWSAAARREPPRLRDSLSVGALLGLLALAYPAGLLLLPVYGFWVWASGGWNRRAFGRAWAGVATAALVIAPATLHNYLCHGEFILISAHGGITLRQGNAPDMAGFGGTIPGIRLRRDCMHLDAAYLFQQIYGRDGSWSEIDNHFRREALDFWFHQPAATMSLFAKKIYLYFAARNYDELNPIIIERQLGIGRRAILAPLAVPWLFGAALAGLIALLRRPVRYGPEIALWLLPLLTVTLFFYCPRYRLPAVPLLCVSAAFALTHLRRFRAPWALTLALFCLPLPLWFVNRAFGIDAPDMVREHYTRAISEAEVLVGNRRLARGELEEAEARFEKALELWSGNPLAHRQIGYLYAKQGRLREAESELTLTARLRPQDPFPHSQLYTLYCVEERYAEAVATLRELRRLRPRDPQIELNLAWLLATCPNDAVRDGKEALQMASTLRVAEPALKFERLDVLAAACAETGDFEQAVRRATEAVRLAEIQKAAGQAATIRQRLDGYQNGQPYRGAPRPYRGGGGSAETP